MLWVSVACSLVMQTAVVFARPTTNKSAFRDADGIQAVVAAMATIVHDTEALKQGCRILANLALDCKCSPKIQ